jgi:hypothetical protein
MEENRKLVAMDEESEAPQALAVEETPSPRLPAADGNDVPEWAVVPKELRPPKGRQVLFLRIPAKLTDTPLKGERQCIVWTLSDGDEKLAGERCEGKAGRASAEYTKQMIRAVDGQVASWMRTSGPGSLEEFWREIGGKGRNILMRVYSQLHLADDEELRDFFENCIAVRTVG